jgi:uncharacterized protein with GYD domain
MPTYIILARMNQQGVQTAKDIPRRRAAAAKAAEDLGLTLRQTYLCMGKYDVVLILDAPDGEAVAKFALTIGSWGNLSTQTMRAFDEGEMDAILSDL